MKDTKVYSVKELFNGKTQYTVPIYHNKSCDKSWDYVESLAKNIFENYQACKDKLYPLETIVLSDQNEIIAGYQVIHMLLVFLFELADRFPENEKLKVLKLNCLEIKHFRDSKQEDENFDRTTHYLKHIISHNLDDYGFKNVSNNIYSYIFEDDSTKERTDTDSFIDYLLEKVIVIVTRVEALSLLDTIKMYRKLNSEDEMADISDRFKIWLFDYLVDIKRMSAETSLKAVCDLYLYFDKTSDQYEDIFSETNELGRSMRDFLRVYQMILTAKYDLLPSWFYYGKVEYFDDMLDSLSRKDCNSIKSLEVIDLSEIKDIIDIFLKCHKDFSTRPKSDKILYCVLSNTKYSKYLDKYNLCIPYLFFHKDDFVGLHRLLNELYKFLFICHVCFYPDFYVRGFMEFLLRKIKMPCDELVKMIFENKNASQKERFSRSLKNSIFWDKQLSRKRENAQNACILFESIKMEGSLMLTPLEIFCNYNFMRIQEHYNVKIDWKESALEKGIGNLVLIESELKIKAEENPSLEKKKIFKKSKLYTAQLLSKLPQNDWTEEDIRKRWDEMVEEIVNYIYS